MRGAFLSGFDVIGRSLCTTKFSCSPVAVGGRLSVFKYTQYRGGQSSADCSKSLITLVTTHELTKLMTSNIM